MNQLDKESLFNLQLPELQNKSNLNLINYKTELIQEIQSQDKHNFNKKQDKEMFKLKEMLLIIEHILNLL